MPSLPPLADADALLARLGVTSPTAEDTERAEQRIAAASAAFRTLAGGQAIGFVADDVVILDGDGSRLLLLPQYPVTAVTSVLVDGADVTAEVTWSELGLIRRADPFPGTYRSVQVTYSHGYDPVPDDVVDAVLDLAEAASRMPAGVTSMQLGAASWRRGATGAVVAAAARYGQR